MGLSLFKVICETSAFIRRTCASCTTLCFKSKLTYGVSYQTCRQKEKNLCNLIGNFKDQQTEKLRYLPDGPKKGKCIAPAFLVISTEILGFGLDLKMPPWAQNLIKKKIDALLTKLLL